MYNLVACKVCYHVLVVTFPMPHDRGCEIKIIVIVIAKTFSPPKLCADFFFFFFICYC